MPLLEARELRKSYSGLDVVRGVNLTPVVGVAPAEPVFQVTVLPGYAAVAFCVVIVPTRRQLS